MSQSRTDVMFSGMSIKTIALIVTAIIEMGMFSFWSRMLTKEDFGYMAAIWGILSLVEVFSSAGLGSAIIQKKDATKEFISTCFTLSLILGIGVASLLFIFAPYLAVIVADDNLTNPLRAMSLLVLAHSMLSVGNSQLTRQLRFKRQTIIGISCYAAASVVGIILAFSGFGLYAMIASCLLSPIFSIIVIYVTSLPIPRISIVKKEISGIVNYGGWLTLGSLMNAFTQRADALLMSRLVSVQALGAYNRPSGFVNAICTKMNSIFDTVLFPLLSQIQSNKDQVKNVLLRAVAVLNSMSVILAAIFFFNAELIITIFFGTQWIELVPIMRIISIGVIFNVDGQLVDCFFRSLNLVKIGTYLRFFQLIIIVAGIVVGSRFDIMGVAIALTITQIVNIIIKVLVLSYKVGVPISSVLWHWVKAWRSVIPILVVSIPYFMVSHNLLVNILYAVVFAIIVVAEFVVKPRYVGAEYAELMQPQIDKIRNRFQKK